MPSSVHQFLQTRFGPVAICCFAGVAAYAGWVLFFPYNQELDASLSSIILIAYCFLFALAAFRLYGKKELDQRVGRGWLLLALAGFSNSLAESIWFYYESVLHVDPFHWLGFILFISYYLLMLAGVMAFPGAAIGREERRILWLDLAIILTMSYMLLWYFFLGAPIQETTEIGTLFMSLAYPIAGMLILMALIDLIQRGAESIPRWSLLFLAVGILSGILADVSLGYMEVHNESLNERFMNMLWLLAPCCLISAAACQESMMQETHPQRPHGMSRGLIRLAFPYYSILIGLALLVLVVRRANVQEPLRDGVLLGTLVLVALVLLRQYIVLRENISLFRQMQQLAITDALTSVYNRHHVNETLQAEVRRASRYGYRLAVLLIDVNGFKGYNDRFGHLRGDEVLKMIAKVLTSQIRATDILGRFGGDEFVAILPEADDQGARLVADRMRAAVAAETKEWGLGVSIGFAVFGPDMTPEKLLDSADKMLYEEKQSRAKA